MAPEVLAFTVVIALLGLIIALQIMALRQSRKLAEERAEQQNALAHHASKSSARLFSQIEAYLSLRDRLDLRQGLPHSHNWSAGPDFLKLIVEHALAAKPRVIVECSSGLTTLMLARCCEINGQGQVFSLENGPTFAALSRSDIKRYSLSRFATVIDAPLQTRQIDGRDYPWYDLEHLPDMRIDMLVIDGPPGFIQRHSRYPALPMLFERMADDGIVFLDDASRPDEREIIEMWQARFPALQHEFIDTERGCSVLRIKRQPE